MAYLTYITGGQRSGKSSFASKLAKSLSERPIYLATAKVKDDEMSRRVDRHKSDRDSSWITIEENLKVGELTFNNDDVVLLDCITLWLTSIFYSNNEDVDQSLEYFKVQWKKLLVNNIKLIVVSNEIGMGLHAHTETGRKFTDLQGWVNQIIANESDEAFVMISGQKLSLK